jgi:hypothetical protein
MSSNSPFSRRRLLSLAVPVAAAIVYAGSALAGPIVEIDVAPPVPRVEVVPAPRVGYVWAPGFWRWDGHHHVWEGGHWEGERRGHHWIAAHWEEHGGHHRFFEGHWD